MKLPWNFSRPGSAWVMGKEGIYVERGVDEPRYQWTPEGKSEGLLLERAATNLVSNSLDLVAATSIITAATVSPNADINPSGEPGCFLIECGSAGSSRVPITNILPSEGLVTGSLWVKAVPGFDGFLRFGLTADNASAVRRKEVALRADRWERLSISDDVTGAGQRHFYLVDRRNESSPGHVAKFLIWSPQVEAGGVATSTIPTSGTPITRPADSLYADMSLVEGFDPTKGTIVVEWVDLSPAGQPLQIGSSTALVPSDYIRISRSTDATGVQLVCKASGIASEATPFAVVSPVNQINRAAFRWSASDRMAIAVNGEIRIRDDLLTAVPTGLRYLRVGQEAHGLYRHVQYIPHAVSDAQLQQLSSLP